MLGTEAWAEAPARRSDMEGAATRAVGWGQQGWQNGKDGGQVEERPSCLHALQLVLGGSEDDIIDSLVCPITHEVGRCFVRPSWDFCFISALLRVARLLCTDGLGLHNVVGHPCVSPMRTSAQGSKFTVWLCRCCASLLWLPMVRPGHGPRAGKCEFSEQGTARIQAICAGKGSSCLIDNVGNMLWACIVQDRRTCHLHIRYEQVLLCFCDSKRPGGNAVLGVVRHCLNPAGWTYERSAIETWLLAHDTSPLTDEALTDKVLIPNKAIHDALQAIHGAVQGRHG